jgi:hypothetical protein
VIELSDVERSTRPSLTVDFSEAVHQYASQKLLSHTGDPTTLHIEACPKREGLFLNGVYQHPFIEAVHRAFADHYPLVLSPQAIWLLIAQGFSSHVNANSEAIATKHRGASRKARAASDPERFRARLAGQSVVGGVR